MRLRGLPPVPRVSWILVVVGLVGLVLVSGLLIPWQWVPGGHLASVRPDAVFRPGQLDVLEDFSAEQRRLGLSSLLVAVLVALVLGLTPLGARLCGRRSWPWPLRVLTGVVVATSLPWLVTLPWALLERHSLLRAGLTHQALEDWFRDQVVGLTVGWVFTSVLLVALVGLARRAPRTWPAFAGVVAAGLVVLGQFVYPVVVEPLFNTFTPLPAGPLRSQVFALARQEGVPITQVLVADASRRTTTVNAYVSGFGDTRRVVLDDTLLRQLPRAQVRVVVAHELAHAKHDDVLVGSVLGAFGTLAAIGLLSLLLQVGTVRRRAGVIGAADPRVVPLVLALMSVGGVLASPVENVMSRAVEARADRDALLVTRDGRSFVALQRSLALTAKADPDPPRLEQLWFGTHPTTVQRIGLAISVLGAPARLAVKRDRADSTGSATSTDP